MDPLLRGDDKEDLFLKLINKDSFTAFVDDDLVKKRSKVYLGVEHSEANVNLVGDEAQNLKDFLKDRGMVPDTYGLKIAILDTENNSLKFYYCDGGEEKHVLPCSITSLIHTYDKADVEFEVRGQTFRFQQLRGVQWYIDEEFADLLYLLKYAGVETLSDGAGLPAQVTVDNAAMVVNRFNQLIDATAELIRANAVRLVKEEHEDERKE